MSKNIEEYREKLRKVNMEKYHYNSRDFNIEREELIKVELKWNFSM